MWKYKGTSQLVRIGDIVELSKRYRKEFGFAQGRVVDLHGFITVKLPNGDRVDFDSRSITFIAHSDIQ